MKKQPVKEQKRQWLDVLAFAVSLLSLALSGYLFYFSEIRLTDELTGTVLSMTTGADTNGNALVRLDLLLRNEGNRPCVISHAKLALSETPTFDLTVQNLCDGDPTILVEPRASNRTRMVFGQGYTNNAMIVSRGFDDPTIYAKLVLEVMDSRGGVHEVETRIGTLQHEHGLNIAWQKMPPFTIQILPSKAPPPYVSVEAPPGTRSELVLKVSNHLAQPVILDGPLSWRLAGVYTNDRPGSWPLKPVKSLGAAYRVQ